MAQMGRIISGRGGTMEALRNLETKILEKCKKLIDTKETILNRILYPNEQEITLKNKGRGVEVVSIRKVKR
jgi:flagellar motility protein MotE (MotC chaperone)